MRLVLMLAAILSLGICVDMEGVLPTVPHPKDCKNLNETINKKGMTCLLKANSNLIYSFSSVRIKINCPDCVILHGATVEDVEKAQSSWNQVLSRIQYLFSAKTKEKDSAVTVLRLSPFLNRTIVIEKPAKSTEMEMKIVTAVDATCVSLIISGLLLFFSARNLSSSEKFYYTGATGIGILASLLIIVFCLSRLVPTKPAAYTILIGGSSLGAWLMTVLWNNWQSVLFEYQTYFLIYIASAGLLSFALCYWKGPIDDQRSQHVFQGAIQIVALLLLYNGSQSSKVSTAIVSCVVIGSLLQSKNNLFAQKSSSFIRTYIWRKKTQPLKLLTEEEYRLQAEIETQKALNELKSYCNSPKCSPWKTLSRIKSPVKFVSFMEGGNHITDNEMTLHDDDMTDSDNDETTSLISDDGTDTGDLSSADNNAAVSVNKKTPVDPNISEDDD